MRAILELIPGGALVSRAWSLATTKLGIAVIALLIGLATGYNWSSERSEIDNLKAQITTLRVDAAIARAAENLATTQAIDLGKTSTSNQEKVDALLADLARRSKERRSCALSDSDARRLRDIK